MTAIHERLLSAGAVPRFVATRLGSVTSDDGEALAVGVTLETAPSVLFDAVVLPDGADGVRQLAADGRTLEFLKDQYRHCKPILALGSAVDLLKRANIPMTLPGGEPDPGLIVGKTVRSKPAVELFVTALAGHRSFARESDPPLV